MHTERPDATETPEPMTPPETPPRPPDDEGIDPDGGESKQGDVNHQPASHRSTPLGPDPRSSGPATGAGSWAASSHLL